MSDQDRSATWDENLKADQLIGGGGIAVWVPRGEAARARINSGADFVTVVTELANLRVGFETLLASVAAAHGVTKRDLQGVVDQAYRVVKPMTDHATRITPSGGGG